MIQGACVFRDQFDNPVLKMYKEIYNGYIFEIIYSQGKFYVNYIKTKKFTALFPNNSIHVVYKLPYYEVDIYSMLDINILIDKWVNYVRPYLYL
jgi:hypothetical protein